MMSYQQTPHTPYWQPHGSSFSHTHQRMPSNNDEFNPNTNMANEQYQPYNDMHHRNQALTSQAHGDLYDSLFPTESLTDPPGMRQLSGGNNQEFIQGSDWTLTPTHAHPSTQLPSEGHETISNHQVTQIHNMVRSGIQTSVPLAVERLQQQQQQQQQPYSHHLQLGSPQSVLHQQTHQVHVVPSQLSDQHLQPLQRKNQHQEHPSTQANVDSNTAEQPQQDISDQPQGATQDQENSPIIRSVTNKVPGKRKANNEDCSYCELCNIVCSGPLNLKMHLNGPKHKLNKDNASSEEATDVGKYKKLRYTSGSRGFVPRHHNQKEKPIIGLDFVTRVVSPDDNDDTYECRLCDKSDMSVRCIYSHVMGKTHRLAYIRKLKPDLAEQYSTVVDVYSENGKLQQREASDLPVLLNSIIKIAAKRDGPGQIFIRLSNEMDSDQEDYQLDYHDEPEDHYASSDESQERTIDDRNSRCDPSFLSIEPLHNQTSSVCVIPMIDSQHSVTLQPHSAPFHHSSTPQSSHPQSSVTVLPSYPQSVPIVNNLPLQSLSSEILPPASSHPIQSASHVSTSQGTQTNLDASSSSHQIQLSSVVSLNAKDAIPCTRQNQAQSLPVTLTNAQLRRYCSDMFISQEYQRRFGDATQPSHSQDDQMSCESNSSISKVLSDGVSLDALLKSLSDTVVNTESDASIAMELTRALTQATLKYRLREKNYALQGRQVNK